MCAHEHTAHVGARMHAHTYTHTHTHTHARNHIYTLMRRHSISHTGQNSCIIISEGFRSPTCALSFLSQLQRTPLYVAVQHGDAETVKALLEAGGDAASVSKVLTVPNCSLAVVWRSDSHPSLTYWYPAGNTILLENRANQRLNKLLWCSPLLETTTKNCSGDMELTTHIQNCVFECIQFHESCGDNFHVP